LNPRNIPRFETNYSRMFIYNKKILLVLFSDVVVVVDTAAEYDDCSSVGYLTP
jgi:hypothetical protein